MSDDTLGPHANTIRHVPISIVPTRILDSLSQVPTVSTEEVAISTDLPLRIRISLPVQSGTTVLNYTPPGSGFLEPPSAVSPNVSIEGTGWPFILRYTGTPPSTGHDDIIIQVPVSAGAPVGQNVSLTVSRDGRTINAALTVVFADKVQVGDLNLINPPIQVDAGPPDKPGHGSGHQHDDDGDINITIINIEAPERDSGSE